MSSVVRSASDGALIVGLAVAFPSAAGPRDSGARGSGSLSPGLPPAFATALERGEDSAESGGRDYVLTASAVPGTTWTLLVATPDSVAFASVPSRALLVAAWLILALVGAVAAAVAAVSRMRRRE